MCSASARFMYIVRIRRNDTIRTNDTISTTNSLWFRTVHPEFIRGVRGTEVFTEMFNTFAQLIRQANQLDTCKITTWFGFADEGFFGAIISNTQ